jgi:nitrate/TMAO reductase-like tetraheme cytochrome c subunit
MNSIRLALAVVALIAASAGIGIWAGKLAEPARAPLAPAVETTGAEADGRARPDYLRAIYDPLHFRPAIETARDEQCLACHREVLEDRVLATSPAGLEAARVKAWYQELATYAGDQETFHRRHLVTPFAQRVMSLRCNTCHEGHDPREEAPIPPTSGDAGFTLRKQIDPAKSCLKCHGQMEWRLMGLPAPWSESKATFAGSCLTCHAGIRTSRHKVNYLKAEAIEAAGQENSDSCFGCHGGRPWYRIAYPYPRHAWEGMAPEVPDWAKGRPTESEARFLAGAAAAKP